MNLEPDESQTVGPSEAGSLKGRCVLVTRALHQAAALAGPLAALGAEVLVAPVIATVDPTDWSEADAAIEALRGYDWVVFTSANAVDRFFGRMESRGVSADRLAETKIAAVGPATDRRLRELGITPDLVPADHRAEGLLEAFRGMGAGEGWRVLIPRAEQAREILPDSLREAGVEVDVVTVYRTVPAEPDHSVVERLRAGEVDVVTFTSPSTARHFLAWAEAVGLDAGGVMQRIAAASIGPVTTEALRQLGYDVPIEAAHSTAAGLTEAIVAHFASE